MIDSKRDTKKNKIKKSYFVDHVIYDELPFWKIIWLIEVEFDTRDKKNTDCANSK